MASTTSSPSGFFASPRNQQWLMWGSGAVLVVGVVVFLGVYFSRGTSQPAASNLLTITTPPASTTPGTNASQGGVKASPAAYRVAREFLVTAVPRKNLDAAYDIVGPNLKGGLSRAQWRTGNIPVTYFPATNLSSPELTVKWSHKNELMLEVGLHGKPGSGVKSLGFVLGVDRIGGKWLVNYFVPDYTPPVPVNPNN